MRLRLPSSPEPTKELSRQRLASIELTSRETGVSGIENRRRRDLIDRHALEVSKPLLEAPRDETQLRQMEMGFPVVGIDPHDFFQQALGAIRPFRTPFDLRLEQQSVAPLRLAPSRFPKPDPRRTLLLFPVAPSLIGHLGQATSTIL